MSVQRPELTDVPPELRALLHARLCTFETDLQSHATSVEQALQAARAGIANDAALQFIDYHIAYKLAERGYTHSQSAALIGDGCRPDAVHAAHHDYSRDMRPGQAEDGLCQASGRFFVSYGRAWASCHSS